MGVMRPWQPAWRTISPTDRTHCRKPTRTELNSLLQAVAEGFGAVWLARDDGNPVQVLWSRKDRLGRA
jgi:hypothetical protein